MSKVLGKKIKIEEPEKDNNEILKKKSLRYFDGLDDSHLIENSKAKTVEVNINDIRERTNNNFIKNNIKELAKSIKEVGIQQPIVIKKTNDITKDGDTIYEVVAGHRRLAAYKMLYSEYKGEDNPYTKIQARILKETDNDNQIYLETNTTTRNTSLIEALLNCDLNEINFDNEDFKNKYISIFYPSGNVPKTEKYNNKSEVDYLEKIIKDTFPSLKETDWKTIRNQYSLIRKIHPDVKNAILEGKISIHTAEKIARFNIDIQPQKLAIVLSGKELTNESIENEKKYKIQNSYTEMLKIGNQLKKVLNCKIEEISTNDFSANSKAYLKQMNKVIEEIKKLDKMPKK